MVPFEDRYCGGIGFEFVFPQLKYLENKLSFRFLRLLY
jgi:hypothetical protein